MKRAGLKGETTAKRDRKRALPGLGAQQLVRRAFGLSGAEEMAAADPPSTSV